MIRKILRWVNYFLLVCVLLLALLVFLKLFHRGGTVPEVALQEEAEKFDQLPKNAFAQSPEAYNAIGGPILTVLLVPPKIELPDLRPYLVYYGINDRPDISATATVLHFGLKGSDTVASAAPGARLYLKYDNSKRPGAYVFSADNQQTRLWIEAEKDANKANVKVRMVNDNGEVVSEPSQRANIVLTASTFARLGGGTWEIGKWKVDGTLLARQRARWLGQDQFLNTHGGEEYADFKDKERIEFGEGNDRYSVYVKSGDCLIWDGQRWQNVRLGDGSRGFPLLCISKIDDRVMTLDLWDVGGQGHVTLNLIKSKEAWTPKTLEQDFKFISTRTLSQYVFEVKKERMVLRPYDWLLLVDKAWVPLTTPEQIDDYVDRKTQGPLYVFVGPVQKEDKQVLQAIIYSPARTEMDVVEYALDQPVLGSPFHAEGSGANAKKPEEEKPVDKDLKLDQPKHHQSREGEIHTPPVPSEDEEPPTDVHEGQEGISPRGVRPDLSAASRFHGYIDGDVADDEDEFEEDEDEDEDDEDRDEKSHENSERRMPLHPQGLDHSSHGQVADLVIIPKTKEEPARLRKDVRYLFQDDALPSSAPPGMI